MYPSLTRSLRVREAPVFAEKCVRVVSEGRLRFLWFRARRKLRRKLVWARRWAKHRVVRRVSRDELRIHHAVKRARQVVTIHD
jgi:hypothetical protein